ncbi:MAG: protein kinase, partial [Chloroflexi bacterium]|nr:protein kinase [Chloroflexota bacterium]
MAAGGQAVVYRAWDTETGGVLALKVLHAHLARDAAYLERFRREAHITASIDHPNVIRIFEVGQDDDSYFISMEFLPESLNTVMEAEGRLSPERAVHIVYQVCLGLQAAYEAGVEVHRDIKPQNILLAPDGTMKLTDFGIARAADLSGMTRTGQFMGTPHYMSPEQARGERADIRTDIYAFGVVLYQMFTGELPFSADTPLAVLRQHIEVEPPSVRRARTDLSPALASVVERCLAKDPARRYQTPRELAEALAQALPGAIPVRAPEPQPPTPTTATGSPTSSTTSTPAAPVTKAPSGPSFCIKCGAGLTPGHKYCTTCGAPVSGAGPAMERPSPVPPTVERPQTPSPPPPAPPSPPPPPRPTPAPQPTPPPTPPGDRRRGVPWRLLIPVAGVAGVALIF